MATDGDHPPDSGSESNDARRLIGQVISGRYRIDELIGEGGMGAVYRATHTHMRKRLAVKVLHPEMLGLTEAVERFEREAIAGAHIEHPNVAAATDFGKLEDGSHFLVLELLEGDDLRTVIGRGPLAPERALKVVRQIALALRAAHSLGIVHRDLKPENIMLVQKEREGEVVKVLDFGIAKVPVNDLAATRGSRTAAALTQLGMVYGTPEYMAPEQALGEGIDGRADLYALGVMFYEMLCGYRPFDANSRVALLGMVATKRPPLLGDRVPGTSVPREIEEIVMHLLEKTAAERYQDADALLEALDIAILELDYSMSPAAMVGVRAGSSADRSGPYRPPASSAVDLSAPSRASLESAPQEYRTAAGGRAARPGLAQAATALAVPTSPRITRAGVETGATFADLSREGSALDIGAASRQGGDPRWEQLVDSTGKHAAMMRANRSSGVPVAALLAGIGLCAIGLLVFSAVMLPATIRSPRWRWARAPRPRRLRARWPIRQLRPRLPRAPSLRCARTGRARRS